MHPWSEPFLAGMKRRIDSLPHALLIHGAQGVGKLALAERIVQLLLCEASDAALKPCGTCEGCRWYLGGNHPDFRRIEPEALAAQPEHAEEEPVAPAKKGKPSQEIKVEQIRELANFLNIGSHRGRRRVALVHPAEEMNPNAANALLKGLEEPPAGAMFVLVSHRPARLLPTIRSRCVAVPVAIPPREAALAWLSAQGLRNGDGARWLAYAGGAPLRAMSYATNAEAVDRLLKAIHGRAQVLPDTRTDLEALAEALQKFAIDNALAALALPPKYGAAGTQPAPSKADLWLAYARKMGTNRALARHPLNPRLFAAEMLACMPEE
jgi:DNA polymerase-3 subunit delta'